MCVDGVTRTGGSLCSWGLSTVGKSLFSHFLRVLVLLAKDHDIHGEGLLETSNDFTELSPY